MIKDWPDLTRTREAIRAFDEDGGSGEAVGEAFALDTADRNASDTAKIVRPGKKNPGHPDNLSFVRKLVKKWEERHG